MSYKSFHECLLFVKCFAVQLNNKMQNQCQKETKPTSMLGIALYTLISLHNHISLELYQMQIHLKTSSKSTEHLSLLQHKNISIHFFIYKLK